MDFNGYKYTKESDAIAARKAINDHFGIPVNKEAVTRNWVDIETGKVDGVECFCIDIKENVTQVLGQKQTFRVDAKQSPIMDKDASDTIKI